MSDDLKIIGIDLASGDDWTGLSIMEKPDVEPCKGIIARYRISMYSYEGKVGRSETFTTLKRRSCKNGYDCPQCTCILEFLGDVTGDPEYFPDTSDLRDQDVVELYIQIEGTDWETGYVDDFSVQVRKVQEEKDD